MYKVDSQDTRRLKPVGFYRLLAALHCGNMIRRLRKGFKDTATVYMDHGSIVVDIH